MANSTSSISQAIDIIYSKYNEFDMATYRAAAQLMGYDVSLIDIKDPKQIFCSWIIKISAIAVVALAAYAMIQNPLILLSAGLVGTIVRPEESTTKSIESWLGEGYARVVQPILDYESLPEKLALSLLAVAILGATLTTVVAPVAMGLVAGYKLRGFASSEPSTSA